MGWTSYHAKFYKNGTVDRKQECDNCWEERFKVVKSAMIGSTYYAAITTAKRYIGKDDNGNALYVDIPANEQETFAAIFLTSVNMKDYFNFSYKDMDETCGPYKYDCPISILNVLSPTENEYALAWRRECLKRIDQKKNPNHLNNLPEGSIIEVILPFNTQRYKKGEKITLTKRKWGKRYKWFTNACYFTQGLMKQLNDNYTIIKRGDE